MRLIAVVFITTIMTSFIAYAGGVGLGSTRVVYLDSMSQSTLEVRNTHKTDAFLIQSWVENADGNRSTDFMITPPLYILKPSSQSVIRLMFNGRELPKDKESIYWLTVKAIPQQNNGINTNTLQFASANRIKIFYRPESLKYEANDAWKEISASKKDGSIRIENKSAFYVTLINIKVNGKLSSPIMIAPKSAQDLKGKFSSAESISYQTINDYGAWTPINTIKINK
ncbi:fimbrial biogenesis chaperone [Klebsiella aerogenes]